MKSEKILIIDQGSREGRTLLSWLRNDGYQVETAAAGKGMERAGSLRPDLIILHTAPPGANHYYLCQKLKTSFMTRNVPLIILTTRTPKNKLLSGLKPGSYEFILKPLERGEVLVRIQNIIIIHRLEKKLQGRLDRFRRLSITDSLTGLCNRREAEKILAREVRRSLKCRTPLAFIVGDLDYFKEINDTYGHKCGDYILKEAAQLFRKNIRKSDCLARPSGDEFWLVAPGVNRSGGGKLCEKLRNLLRDAVFDRVQPSIRTTISWGVSELKLKGSSNADRLIEEADQAMYRSKHRGRNQTSVFRGLL